MKNIETLVYSSLPYMQGLAHPERKRILDNPFGKNPPAWVNAIWDYSSRLWLTDKEIAIVKSILLRMLNSTPTEGELSLFLASLKRLGASREGD
jgi:hypothetical protein